MKIYKVMNKCNSSGPMIRYLRNQRKWSQTLLADELQSVGLKLKQRAICRIENGQRVVADFELEAFAAFFGLPMEALMKEPPKNAKT